MRLKTMDGPLSAHNGNNDIINSPKRINTIHNSNVATNYGNSTTSNFTDTSHFTSSLSNDVVNGITELQTGDLNELSNVIQDKVQWCNPSRLEVQNRELANNCRNINNTLAATFGRRVRRRRATTASSICSESSPDDSLFDFEDAEQSCSSADASPQDEDPPFDLSDSETSEDGNLSSTVIRGIVNPNYPGFQHLAHTLASDAEYTDDEFDAPTGLLEANNNNNNNNDAEETDYRIDSVNRLDSVENIQKVFYDKPAFNIERDDGDDRESDSASGNSNTSDEDIEIHVPLNVNVDEKGVDKDIVGDFSGEIEAALVRVTFNAEEVFEDPYQSPRVKTAVVQELEEAVEKLLLIKEVEPSASKYNIEPNIEEPFEKLSPTKQIPVHRVLNDTALIKNTDTMAVLQDNSQFGIKLDDPIRMKIEDAFLSTGTESLKSPLTQYPFTNFNLGDQTKMEVDTLIRKTELTRRDSNREQEEVDHRIKKIRAAKDIVEPHKENLDEDHKEKGDEDSSVPRKKERVDTLVKRRRDYNQQIGSLITFPRRENGARNRDPINRRSVPMTKEKKRNNDALGGFDVYNIETAMPKIDLEAIECHLRAAREEERRRRTDREEIRRRLATGSEEEFYSDRPGRKPSLQARLQSGMNLQICFMNESLSDTDSPTSDADSPPAVDRDGPRSDPNAAASPTRRDDNARRPAATRPATLAVGPPPQRPLDRPASETDFFARQARLQTEARMALAQAKEMARMQMEIEKQRQKKSPITEMIRNSMEKVGIPFPEEKRRLSRQILTDMNVAQLQVIVNDLHTQIETLNEGLVKFLMNRDDLHMEQDSKLVDIEDLTRYLGAKEQVNNDQNTSHSKNNNTPPSPAPSSPLTALNSTMKPHLNRIASLVKK